MKLVSIFSPVANEEDCIVEHLTRLSQLKQENYEFNFVFVLDEYSTDTTQQKIEEFSKRDSRFLVHRFLNQSGLAKAYIEGYKRCLDLNPDIIIEMDVESHPIAEIPNILQELERVDMVFMSRNLINAKNKSSKKRRFISFLGTMLSRAFLGLHLSDNTSGFQAFRSEVVRQMNFDNFVSTSYLFQTEMKYRCMSLLVDSVERETKASAIWQNRTRKFFKEFLPGFKKYKHAELPFVYRNSKSSISIKKIYKSFLEFVSIVMTEEC